MLLLLLSVLKSEFRGPCGFLSGLIGGDIEQILAQVKDSLSFPVVYLHSISNQSG